MTCGTTLEGGGPEYKRNYSIQKRQRRGDPERNGIHRQGGPERNGIHRQGGPAIREGEGGPQYGKGGARMACGTTLGGGGPINNGGGGPFKHGITVLDLT